MMNSEFGSPCILTPGRFYVSEPRARLLYITNNYFPKIEIYSSLVGKVTGLYRLLRVGSPGPG